MKTAVVLFVKDEAHDILSWIIWHKLVGFDTFIICDDGSTDGTASLLKCALNIYDIRFYQNEFMNINFFYYRQEAFYKMVLHKYKEEFDWIAFLDADEYLSIDRGVSLRGLLESFPDADAIAIHWALYGSSGNILTPRIPSVAAFTLHSDPSAAICKHVKSIVRPSKVGSDWKNVHAFDVAAYQNCDREFFHWGHIPGVTREPPTWANAKIMHFQLRSMEQFIERCKRRPDVKPDRNLFDSLDQNIVEDLSPRRWMPEIMLCLREVVGYFAQMPVSDDDLSKYIGDWAAFKLTTAHGDAVGGNGNELRAFQIGDSEVVALMSAIEGKCVLLVDKPSAFHSAYHSSYDPISEKVVLQDCNNLKFMTAVPRIHGGMVKSRGETENTWEVFSTKLYIPPFDSCAAEILEAFNSCAAPHRAFGLKGLKANELLLQVAIHTTNQNDIASSAKFLHRQNDLFVLEPNKKV